MSLIQVENVYKDFEDVRVLKGVHTFFNASEKYVIQGASGSGKSTLLYLIGGLDRPTSGAIISDGINLNKLNDTDLAKYRNTHIGFVFQFHFLLPSMSSLENILLPSRIAGASESEVREKSLHLAKHLGVDHCLEKLPYQLSGGEQQRINIIRALSLKPKILLCDEPTGNLDSKNTSKVMGLLHELADEYKTTLIVVTHDDKVGQTFKNKFVIEDGCFIS